MLVPLMPFSVPNAFCWLNSPHRSLRSSNRQRHNTNINVNGRIVTGWTTQAEKKMNRKCIIKSIHAASTQSWNPPNLPRAVAIVNRQICWMLFRFDVPVIVIVVIVVVGRNCIAILLNAGRAAAVRMSACCGRRRLTTVLGDNIRCGCWYRRDIYFWNSFNNRRYRCLDWIVVCCFETKSAFGKRNLLNFFVYSLCSASSLSSLSPLSTSPSIAQIVCFSFLCQNENKQKCFYGETVM